MTILCHYRTGQAQKLSVGFKISSLPEFSIEPKHSWLKLKDGERIVWLFGGGGAGGVLLIFNM